MECEYCGNIFTTRCSLNKHQRTARYCIKLREKSDIPVKKFVCEYCDATFTSRYRQHDHTKKCRELYQKGFNDGMKEFQTLSQKQLQDKDKTIAKLEAKIERLENKLENIAVKGVTKSTTTTNNNIIIKTLEPLTKEKLESIQGLNISRALEGGTGYGKIFIENGLGNSVACTDISRKAVIYKNEEGILEPDPGLRTVSSKFFDNIKDKNSEVIDNYAKGHEFDEPQELISKLSRAADIKTNIEKAVGETDSDVYEKFSKYVCQKTYTPKENVKVA